MSTTQPSTLLAQVDLGEGLKIGNNSAATLFNTPADIINKLIIPNVFTFAGFLFLAMIVAGGYKILLAGNDSKGLEKGKEQITNAAIGFVIVFIAYWIIQLVEIFLGVQILL